jgi:anti-sigma regulatory factor (Ser/Thr protein kinase)
MPPLAALPTAPACARAFVRQALSTWLLDSVADVAEIVISELATNAVNASTDAAGLPLYFGGRMAVVRVCVLTDGVRVLLEVHDQAPGVPLPWHAAADDEYGRGLELVDALSDRWGWRPADGRPGKCVWAQIPVFNSSPLSKRR